MKDTILLEVKDYIRTCSKGEIGELSSVLESRRLELQKEGYANIKLRNAKASLRHGMAISTARDLFGEDIYTKMIEEGFIYEIGDKVMRL